MILSKTVISESHNGIHITTLDCSHKIYTDKPIGLGKVIICDECKKATRPYYETKSLSNSAA